MTRLAVILTGFALSLFAASPAAAARTEFFGISQSTNRLDNTDLQGMAAARVQTERFMLKWASVQPSQGTFDWADTDTFVGRLASHGVRPVPFVWGSPRWVAPTFARPPIDTAAQQTAWQNFLKAAVKRYRPNGDYWATNGPYHQQYGPGATELPIVSWQVWNEPNLPKSFAPNPSAAKYAQLLQLSHDAIKSQDPAAQIILGGLVAYQTNSAWNFLGNLYQVAGVRSNFNVVALHPYAPNISNFSYAIQQVRGVMAQHGDGGRPLWLTEVAWGSDPKDGFGINQGLAGQNQRLFDAYNLVLRRRTAWHVQRVFWFYWRDPSVHPPGTCSFCSSAGLLYPNRDVKPAYNTFKFFTATPPQASITSGPSQGGLTKDSTPTFSFTSNKTGSTFQCRFDAQAFSACPSPFTRGSPLADGAHTFFVKAIDANANESAVRSRSFTVDTVAPAAPQITATNPASPANNNTPKVKGSAAGGSTVRLYKTAGCTGSAVASGSAAQFASPGISASVADNTTTSFRATATDAAGNASPCSAPRNYVEDSTAPQTTVTGGPTGSTTNHTPTFTFTSSEAGSTFQCRFDSQPFAACSGPGASHTPSTPLSSGLHSFAVRATDKAKNIDATPATRSFTVV